MIARVALLVLLALVGLAGAQPPSVMPADALREGNTAATVGDWAAVSRLVDPLLESQLPPAELAEAHRLAGLAAFFQDRRTYAEQRFLAYLHIDIDGQLDPALYPPDVILFFNDVKAKYGAELRARRPKQRRHFIGTMVPGLAQWQNGESTKGWVVGGMFGTFLAGSITSYVILSSWCTRVNGEVGSSVTCDESKDRRETATRLRAINLVTSVGALLTFVYSAYDGVKGYRRVSRERAMQPFATITPDRDALFGVAGTF